MKSLCEVVISVSSHRTMSRGDTRQVWCSYCSVRSIELWHKFPCRQIWCYWFTLVYDFDYLLYHTITEVQFQVIYIFFTI